MYLHNIIFIIQPSAVGQSNAVAVAVAPQFSLQRRRRRARLFAADSWSYSPSPRSDETRTTIPHGPPKA